ncbi:unnamed protein product [Vitrella brassicaformis CCMP3155]|uniref:DOMON domain-containing protein n=3 Tax=Vitrella brassicaformis TaxID=1169539 RepID=A0A0G4EDN8_VITBC|nr:unnamed protein product [Vitrella brassicaformis CCMP3155]|eukprot:CEL93840.1 unnamed protein product [Vitrella brassicaformis CCMP3155]
MIWLSLAAVLVALLPSTPIALECNAPNAGALSSIPHCVPLSDEAIFYWRFDDSRGKIQLGGHFKAAGWVGLGLSANGGMKGADIIVVREGSNGTYVVEDMFSTDYAMPTLDAQQNVELIFANRTGQETVFLVERDIEPCDIWEDFDISKGEMKVIAAWQAEEIHELMYHGPAKRVTKALILRDHDQISPIEQTPGIQTVDIQMPNVTIPSKHTTYMCLPVVLPDDRKYHMVANDPLISPQRGGDLVHHMIIYHCDAPEEPSSWLSGPKPCGEMKCGFWAGWAVGGGRWVAPEQAGMPMGKGQGSARYVMLEVHYDNREFLENITDSSGFRLFYTDDLRTHDAAVLTLGRPLESLKIPPGESSFLLSNECPGECTYKKLPAGGLTVFGVALHAHEYGTSIITRHIRDGKELAPLGHQPYYDFNHQQMDYVDSRKILPGDRFITECVFNSERADKPILGGESTTEEMCFAFTFYYPMIKGWSCLDFVEQPGFDDIKNVSADTSFALCSGESLAVDRRQRRRRRMQVENNTDTDSNNSTEKANDDAEEDDDKDISPEEFKRRFVGYNRTELDTYIRLEEPKADRLSLERCGGKKEEGKMPVVKSQATGNDDSGVGVVEVMGASDATGAAAKLACPGMPMLVGVAMSVLLMM